MKSTAQTPQLFNFSPEILEEIKDMQDYDDDGFIAYSRALDNIFFEYIHNTIDDQVNSMLITKYDVYCLQKVKRLLELLQKSATDNQTK